MNTEIKVASWIFGAAMLVGCSLGQSGILDNDIQVHAPDAEFWTSADPCTSAVSPAVARLMGRYEIVSVKKFRGGLTSHSAALERVGETMLMAEAEFRFGEDQLTAPKYEIACHNDIPVEGEVPTYEDRALSTFYGVATDRDVVWVVTVLNAAGEPKAGFEVLPNANGAELWQLEDGWLFVLRRME